MFLHTSHIVPCARKEIGDVLMMYLFLEFLKYCLEQDGHLGCCSSNQVRVVCAFALLPSPVLQKAIQYLSENMRYLKVPEVASCQYIYNPRHVWQHRVFIVRTFILVLCRQWELQHAWFVVCTFVLVLCRQWELQHGLNRRTLEASQKRSWQGFHNWNISVCGPQEHGRW